MIKMKPVWRMNTEEKVPSDLGDYVAHFGGLVCNGSVTILATESYIRKYNFHWQNDDIMPVIAYQTNRTKKAKYQKVRCDLCLGRGKHFDPNPERGNDLICPTCQGHGHTWELIK